MTQAPERLAPGPGALVPALRQRLQAAATTLGVEASTTSDDPATAASELFGALVDHVHRDTGTESLWLLLTALAAALPDLDDVQAAARERDLTSPNDFAVWLLEGSAAPATAAGALECEMDVVTDSVVVDVDFSARQELHTGIQRVVRETVPRWARDHDVTFVAWTDADGAMRRLEPDESDRVLRWNDPARRRLTTAETDEPQDERPPHRLVVPWRCDVLLPEIPAPEHCPGLAAVARYSGNRVALIGHDCIPVISPELIHTGLADRFTRFLLTVKHAHRVVGVSESAAREFRGFVGMLGAQGLAGPTVAACPLPVEVPPGTAAPSSDGLPLVVGIGSFEPRKNQLAVLHAAEHLWREGLKFRLQLIGGGGWATEFDRMMARLRSAGRPVGRLTAVTDEQLWATVRAARFTVFVSLHEGFGLPVAESLACGVPCLTTAYGSTRETAAGGGALVVDPTDDDAIAEQMRRLLTDDALIATLREQARKRPERTWDDYAAQVWSALVAEDAAQEVAA